MTSCVFVEESLSCLLTAMSSRGDYRRGRQEEPDWRSRENRGHSWFTNMKREKDKKKTGRDEWV